MILNDTYYRPWWNLRAMLNIVVIDILYLKVPEIWSSTVSSRSHNIKKKFLHQRINQICINFLQHMKGEPDSKAEKQLYLLQNVSLIEWLIVSALAEQVAKDVSIIMNTLYLLWNCATVSPWLVTQ